ncbi:hypothetical protein, partial [Acidianus sp. RZ1]|uniref:hypothetical protein n=1 Tax=Acidianus sp. RZ1 TaxID=1540082 RepID=UPI001C118B8F
NNISLISLLIINEIIMSFTYYEILRGFSNAVISLDFYATDVPTVTVTPIGIIISLMELPNSFMFLLMIYPEIAYLCIKKKDPYPIMLSSLSLAGANIASQMTHSILPLPYDPIKEANVFASIISLIFSIYFTLNFLKNKIDIGKYISFLIVDLFLSIGSVYYALTLNEIPYGIATICGIVLGIAPLKFNVIRNFKIAYLFSWIPQLLWGFSIALWYFYGLVYLSGIMFSLFYIITLITLKTWLVSK